MVDGKTFTRSTGTSNRRNAEKKLAEFIAPYLTMRGAKTDAKASKKATRSGMAEAAAVLSVSAKSQTKAAGRIMVKLTDAWETFDSSLSKRTVSGEVNRIYQSRWEVFRRWMTKNRPLAKSVADVDAETAVAFMKSIRKGRSPKTANDYRSLLFQIWKVLDEPAGLDGFNPWSKERIKPLELDTHNRRELTVEELSRVVAPLEGEMRVLFALGIYTGLRLGDCINLDWGAVDLVRGFVQWKPHKTKKHGTMVRIPLFPALAAILSETPAKERTGAILPHLSATYGRYTCERVRKAFMAAGIQTRGETGRKRKAVEVGFHSLRHTFVSLCANAGVPLHVVQAIVGHSNASMTQHYFHVSDEALRGAVKVLPDVFTPAALPAPGGATVTANISVKKETDDTNVTLEAVPPKVAKVARMLEGCSDDVLAKAEKMLAKWLTKERAK